MKERGEEDRMKTERKKKEKELGVFKNKRNVGTEPSAILYIGILVTSTTTGHDGSVVSALAYQAKDGFNSQLWQEFIFSQVFSFFPFQPLSSN